MLSLLILSSQHLISSQLSETFITNSSISWINNRARSYVVDSTDGATLTPILSREWNETLFVFGFLCDYNGTACVFGVLISPNIYYSYLSYPRLVWSANRNNPVRANATLQLRQDGGLLLIDSDGTMIWSTSTSGKVVAGFNLTVLGNLVLFDKSNHTIWQSFDHPTDTLVPGQMINGGQKLRSSVSATNRSEGLFTLEVQRYGFLAYIESIHVNSMSQVLTGIELSSFLE
ncbi:EP1-like glycoprotein 2 [Solanum stenotomum]|uniref:EP1-like glycoprotein 2 n=1 Tax=Solanum stenotomum TaxID=172797 RepID=UPI0020D1EAAE|nr:EP1-like glycoprotein 2 [Solanum stenotomum]